ncbi:MAG TPA: ComEC/Rec2 family competence protein, partial [Candidatus Absconditabacterales bacterium]|nr:ComEC/Rec2 family competence protein [Candidatus Absconditabacterales bacterium]
ASSSPLIFQEGNPRTSSLASSSQFVSSSMIKDPTTLTVNYSPPGGQVEDGHCFYSKEDSSSEQNCKSKISFIQKIRKGLQKMVVSAYGENKQAGLILGMLVGDRSQIPPDDYQGFVKSGLVHIIAVSGGNIIMIVVFLGAILFFLPFYVRNAVILLTIILYSMICGLDSSVFRATVMGGLGMLALFWGKEINIWRAMSTAFIVMLIINPYFLAYDVGFLLSFSAIIGIIYFGKLIENCASYFKKQGADNENQTTITSKKKKNLFKTGFQKFLKEFVTPTVGATIGVLPVMLFFMGTTNLTGIIANFLVVPIVAVVMIYGFISTVLFQVLPWEIRLWPEKLLLNYIYFMSELAQRFGVYLHAEGSWIKYVLLGLFIVWLVLVRMRR